MYNPLSDLTTTLTTLLDSDLGVWKGTSEKSIRVEPSNPILEPEGLLCTVSRMYHSNPYISGNLKVDGDATFKVTLVQYDTTNVTSLVSAFEKITTKFNVVKSHYQSDSSGQFFEQAYLHVLMPFTTNLN